MYDHAAGDSSKKWSYFTTEANCASDWKVKAPGVAIFKGENDN
jgi:hypothetical protein